jgi:transforming growth factor-beta-induced protein
MNRRFLSSLLLALLLIMAAVPGVQAQEAQDIVDIAASNEDFSTLVAAVQAAGLVDALKGEGPFTVFAPTNAAFAALPDGALDALVADPTGDLTQILLYHVLSGQVMAADVTDGLEATTLQGGAVTFTVADGAVKINDANIVVTDIQASNGVIHVIDAVIVPPAPESTPEATPEPAAEAPVGDIVDIAASNEDFSTLVAAVQAAGLVDALKGEGPFTVFGPTNAAFAALPDGALDALVADPAGDLTQILLYHVLSGKVMAADVTDGLEATTLQGGAVTFTVTDGAVKINDANIVVTDIEATNGVIHVIDAVIVPPAPEATPEATPEPAEEAPTTMPATGGDLGNTSLIFTAIGLVVAALAFGTWANRRAVPVRNR